jgi:hypothetical protein
MLLLRSRRFYSAGNALRSKWNLPERTADLIKFGLADCLEKNFWPATKSVAKGNEMTETYNFNEHPSPFDNLSALRLDQSYADSSGVKKLLTTVPVRKPNRQDFVRVHPDPGVSADPGCYH